MNVDPDAVADALASGDTDRTNRALDELDELETVERYQLYDDLVDACRPVFESEDGYVRQSVVRALREGYPRLEFAIGGRDGDAIEGVTLADAADQRERYVSVLLEALDDEDGRVRRAAVDAFDTLAVGLAIAKLDAEQERIREELQEIASEQSPEKRAHTEEACDALDRFGVGGLRV